MMKNDQTSDLPYLQVVTTALSESWTRHFNELQRNVKSMIRGRWLIPRDVGL